MENEIFKTLENLIKIDIICNNKKISILNNTNKFQNIKNKLHSLFCSARLMPAYGVSLDESVKEEIKNGSWIELTFSKEQVINNLPFNKLLIKLEECYGFNLIRNYKDSYTGRCLFIDLDNITNLNELLK